jgi:hypothetical protein
MFVSLGRRVVVLPLLLASVLPALGVGAAHADISMSVAPSLVELTASPAGSGDLDLTVTNEGTDAFDVAASLEPYKDATSDRSAVPWLTLSPANFTLAAGQQQSVHVHVDVPANIASGGRYALAAFRTTVSGAAGGQVGVSGQLGVPLLIGVQAAGPLNRIADLDQIVPVLEPDGGLGFWTALRNDGNLHVVSRGGSVDLLGTDGHSLGELALPESTAILPMTEEALTTDSSLPFDAGATYLASANVTYGGTAPASGQVGFTANAALSVSDLTATDSTEHGPTLDAGLRNDGALGLLPVMQFVIRDATGQTVQSVSPPHPPLLLPGQSARIETQLPHRLPTGDYVLGIHAQYGQDSVDQETRFHVGPVSIGNSAPTTAPIPAEMVHEVAPASDANSQTPASTSSNLAVVLALLGIGLLGALGGFVLLPPLAGFRRRLGRAARSFAAPVDE